MNKIIVVNECIDCGKDPQIIIDDEGQQRAVVICNNCGVGVFDYNEIDIVIKNWNKINEVM